jgi:subtilisin family serine protease
MKTPILVAASAAFLLISAGAAFAGDEGVIVGFKTGTDASLVSKHGGGVDASIDGVHALACHVPASAISALRAEADVAYVEEDGIAEALGKGASGKPGGGTTQPAQSTPWGISRVGAPVSGNAGSGVKVAIIDTGIDLNHPDLAGNVNSGATFVSRTSTPDDDNGHGTHVAGIVAALDNTIGVVGVAPEAALYPVKVLDKRGSGTWSAVASGIGWAVDHGMNVANMSLGGGANSTLETACSNAESAGVLLIAAAGNSGDGNTSTTELSYPAAYSSVVAVGATDSSDHLASFSNTGSFLEVSGPGVNVYSTYKGDGYATLSGTSMASPHATGVAALLWNALGSSASASSVRSELANRAVDLGSSGFDNGFGWGLVHY